MIRRPLLSELYRRHDGPIPADERRAARARQREPNSHEIAETIRLWARACVQARRTSAGVVSMPAARQNPAMLQYQAARRWLTVAADSHDRAVARARADEK